MRVTISEIIVVEGRDDVVNLQRFVTADFIITKGFQLSQKTFINIEHAAKNRGIIILTDPDFAGNVIRTRIVKKLKAVQGAVVKHAYISRDEGTKNGDVGVENAQKDAVLRALQNAKAEIQEVDRVALYSERDLYALGLVGTDASKQLREALGQYLKIGYGNGKQFLNRLNAYQIPPESIAAFFDARNAEEDSKYESVDFDTLY